MVKLKPYLFNTPLGGDTTSAGMYLLKNDVGLICEVIGKVKLNKFKLLWGDNTASNKLLITPILLLPM